MNYRIVRKSDLTFHHIQKRCEDGKEVIENGAIIGKIGHEYLHIIEYKDIKTYNAINKMFMYINKQLYEPTMEQRQIIEYLLREFESEYKETKNSRGDLLIKRKYLERGFIDTN